MGNCAFFGHLKKRSPPPTLGENESEYSTDTFESKIPLFSKFKNLTIFETTKSGNFKIDIFFENFLILGDFTAIFVKKPVILGQK